MTIAIGIGLLLLLLVLEMPVAFALIVSAIVGLWMIGGETFVGSYLADTYHGVAASYVFLTIPMFVLLAQFMAKSGIARDIIRASNLWLGRLPGGLGIACVTAAAFIAATIGSSTASCAAMSATAYPTMREVGYERRISAGIIAISGTLAIMIPPSIVLIIYGVLTEESIGKLLIAGLLPGLMTALGYFLTILVLAIRNPDAMPAQPSFEFKPALRALKSVWPMFLLMVLIIGGLYSGIATATEIGAIGAAAALLITIVLGRLDYRQFWLALQDTLTTTVMVVTIVVGAMLFGYFLTLTQATQALFGVITESGMEPWMVICVLMVIYLVLGMFMDQIAILVLTVPVTYALVTQLGFDGIWFGILITKTVEIGLVTPPLGLNAFVTSGATKVPVRDCFLGVAPFLAVEIFVLLLLATFPQISLFLPSLMSG